LKGGQWLPEDRSELFQPKQTFGCLFGMQIVARSIWLNINRKEPQSSNNIAESKDWVTHPLVANQHHIPHLTYLLLMLTMLLLTFIFFIDTRCRVNLTLEGLI
jgi:hypothetical protein